MRIAMIKEKIDFTDLTISCNDLLRKSRRVSGPVDNTWIRVKIKIPNQYAIKKIEDWIEENLIYSWFSYHFQDRIYDKKSTELTMILRFESNNDALMFKLKDGYNAWQNYE